MSQHDSKPDEQESPKMDSRLVSFLRKAGPIISTERGINARSRVKLESLARDIKLPEELFEQGLQMLQSAPQNITSRQNRWERAFAKRIRTQLESKSIAILTARMETKAIRVAREKYQLEEVQAREIIQAVAKEVGIGRITVSEAVRHIEELVRDKVGRSIWVDPSNRDWLHEAGRQWGVEATKVESLINLFVDENRRTQRRKKRLATLSSLSIVIGVFAILGVGLAALLVWTDSPITTLASSGDEDDESDSSKNDSTKTTLETPDWWDEQLQVGVIQARLNTDGFKPLYPSLISESQESRADGYVEMTKLLQTRAADRQSVARLVGIATSVVRLEPEESNAELMAQNLTKAISPNSAALPERREYYQRTIETVGMIADSALGSDMPEERKQLLLGELGAVTGVGSMRDATKELYVRRHQAGFCEASYRALISAAASQPKQGVLRLEWLQSASYGFLDPARKLELESQFLLTVIPTDHDDWARFQTNLLEVLAPENPLLYRFITLAETSPNTELQRYLFSALCGILDVPYQAGQPENLANALRRHLGVVPGMAEDEQSRRFASLMRRAGELPDPEDVANHPTAPPTDQLEQVAYLTTLSCLLAQFPSQGSQFDLLLGRGPDLAEADETSDEAEMNSTTVRIDREPTSTDNALLERFVSRFDEWESASPAQRLQSFNSLESLGPRFRDITPEAAVPLAKYITGSKEKSEHDTIVSILKELAHWNHLTLAVADNMESTPLATAWQEEIVIALAGGNFIELSSSANTTNSLRAKLYQVVLDRIADKKTAPARNEEAEDLQKNFSLNYKARLEAISPNSNRLGGMTTADLVERYVQILAPTSRSSRTAPLTNELDSIHYLAQSDIERAVLSQRVACQALAEKIKRSHPESTTEAVRLIDQLNEWDRTSNHILGQLYCGEWVQLQLWMKMAN